MVSLALAGRRSLRLGPRQWDRVLPNGRAKKWPDSEAPSHRWYGQQLCWSRRGPRVALERSLYCLSMRYDADRRRGHLVFRKRNRQTGALVPTQSLWGTAATAATADAAADASVRVAGMIKKAVYRSSGRRVRDEDDKIPPIKTVAPDVPLAVLRRMDIRVDPWSAPTCAAPNASRIRPAHARTSGKPEHRRVPRILRPACRAAERPAGQQRDDGALSLPNASHAAWVSRVASNNPTRHGIPRGIV